MGSGGSSGPRAVGVDVGGTKILAVVADADGVVLAERRVPTPKPHPGTGEHPAGDVLDAVAAVAGELDAAVDGVGGLGVGLAGLVDLDGAVLSAPNLPGFAGVAARAELARRCHLPVVVDNDANVAAVGEVRHGAGRGFSDVLVVTLGTGIGGGLVIGGRVRRGASGLAAEIGHFTVDPAGPVCACGVRGHWEAFASGSALGRRAREWAARGDAPGVLARAGGDPGAVGGLHVAASAAAGEADGLALVAEHARDVALGLGGLVNILDPGLVVVGGGLVDLGESLLEPVRQALPEFVEAAGRRSVPAVVAAALGERAGAIGAAALALAADPVEKP